jgi:predicted dehydrogenase/acetyltransferase-like isoleucine patch superfamily enzyme
MHRNWIAVIGCGYWGKNIVRSFHELGALAAVADCDTATADGYAALYSAPARSVDAILADTAIHGIAIATPPSQHFPLAAQALQAGKHVFVEKPLALEVSEAETLCRLADQHDRRLMVGHLLQYHPAFMKLRDIVRNGQLGRLQYIYSNRLNLGRIRREEDILWSFAPHDISMILALVGEQPEQVWAVGGTFLHPRIADVTVTHLAFASGEQAHVFVSWLHPFKEQKLVVVGDKAMAVFDDGQPWTRKLLLYPHHIEWRNALPTPERAQSEIVALDELEPLRVECQHFLDCIATGRTPRTDGREGLRVLKVLAAATASLGSSKRESLQQTARPLPHGFFVHETACVDSPVEIGKGTRVWHFSHVLPGSRIGRNVVVGQNVVIGPGVSIGDNCKIQNNVSIYKGVTLEDGVFCGPSCVFTNVINPRAEIERKSEFLSTLVCRGATIGANATIICGVTLGEYCFVGAGAVVTHDVPPFALVVGVPARRIGWVSHAGERLGPSLVCPRSKRRYQEIATNRLQEIV